MKKQYIIIGQGLAGTILSWHLYKRNQDFIIIDNNHKTASSLISIGMLNPITGIRLVYNQQYLNLYEYAQSFYKDIENTLKDRFFKEINILKFFQKDEEIKSWNKNKKRFQDLNLIKENFNCSKYHELFNNKLGGIEINKSAQIHVNKFIHKSKAFFEKKKMIISEDFDYTKMSVFNDKIKYKNITSEKIIFCEGFQMMNNPYFKNIPCIHAKGDILTIQIHSRIFPQQCINFGKFIIPIGNNLYHTGSTYIWNTLDLICKQKEKDEIIKHLKTFLKCEFEVVNHICGIRPIVKDQQPVIGISYKNSNILIFNGFGSKATHYAPYYAKQLCSFLNQNADLDKNVNILRFL